MGRLLARTPAVRLFRAVLPGRRLIRRDQATPSDPEHVAQDRASHRHDELEDSMLLGPLVRSLLLATLPLSLALAQGQPPVQFRPLTKRWMPLQSDDALYAYDLAIADVDGDGDLDLFVGTSGQDRLYRNDGRGVFDDVSSSQLGAGSQGTNCAAFVDVDGDGDLDLVQGRPGQDRLWRNLGGGAFVDVTSASLPAHQGSTESIVVGDVDADGDPDLVILRDNGQFQFESVLYRNNGSGTFSSQPTSLPILPGPGQLAIGDLDGDGDLDLLLRSPETATTPASCVTYHVNDGAGGFSDVTTSRIALPLVQSRQVALFDADFDGDLDMVSVNAGLVGNRFYRNDGSGNLFDDTDVLFAATANGSIEVADLDRDGHLDLVVGASEPGGTLEVLRNNGLGAFAPLAAPGTSVPIGVGLRAYALGDLDGDLDPDLAVSGFVFDAAFGGTATRRDRWLANDGFGNLVPHPEPELVPGSFSTIADLDLDGLPDILTFGDSPLRLLQNLGKQRFATAVGALPNLGGVGAVCVADFDGDLLPDVFAARRLQATATGKPGTLLRNNFLTGFVDASVGLPVAQVQCESASAGDADNDGDIDILLANLGGATTLLVNDGFGGFSATSLPHSGTHVAQLVDLDLDGDLDAVVATQSVRRVHLLENTGNLVFVTRATFSRTSTVTMACATDLDGDAYPDVFFGTFSQPFSVALRVGPWSYLQTQSTSPWAGVRATSCVALDADGDGDTDIVTMSPYGGGSLLTNDGAGGLTPMVRAWDENLLGSGISAADLDLDGDVDLVRTPGTIYWNQQFAMNAPDPAEIGRRYRIELSCRPGTLSSPVLAGVAFSLGEGFGTLPGFLGQLGLDPATLVVAGIFPVPTGSGLLVLDTLIPNAAGLQGITLWGQAAFADPQLSAPMLSNTTSDEVR